MPDIKTIWIFNHYASSDFDDKGGRHYCLAKYLKRFGYEPTVFCCNIIHNTDRVCIESDSIANKYMDGAIDVPFVFIKGRAYKGNGKTRFLNMLDFYRNLKKAAVDQAVQDGLPDIIYASSVHPLTLVAGIQLAKRFSRKCVSEVRDLWPESIVEYSDHLNRSNPIIRLLYAGEKWIYKKSDAIIFTFKGGYDYLMERGWTKAIPESKVFHVNNGVDLEVFDHNRETYTINDEDLDNEHIIKIVYTGSIRKVNNLGRLLDIAKLVSDPNVRFLVWGDGDELDDLKGRLEREQITNVKFKGRVDKKFVPYITSRATVNFAHNNPSALFRFGISFNKIFDYLAAGRPVLVSFGSKYNPVVEGSAAILPESFSDADIARAIDSIGIMEKEEYRELCINARNTAEEYSYETLARNLAEILNIFR